MFRVSLSKYGTHHDDRERLAQAMEHVIAGQLPPAAVELALSNAATDVVFAIAVAHPTTGADLAALLAALAPFAEIPDVAILLSRVPAAPQLLRASLRLVMTRDTTRTCVVDVVVTSAARPGRGH